jgi:hypothetical protein
MCMTKRSGYDSGAALTRRGPAARDVGMKPLIARFLKRRQFLKA